MKLPNLQDPQVRSQALEELDEDTKAKSTHSSDESRLVSMADSVRCWGLQLFPPTIASFKAVAATLKSGGYKSTHVYLSVYRVEAERCGFATGPLLSRSLKDWKSHAHEALAVQSDLGFSHSKP